MLPSQDVCTRIKKKCYNFSSELGAEHDKTESRTTGVLRKFLNV